MPLKLRPPRPGKSPNFEIRGTYLGIRVDKTSGSPRRSVALAELKRIENAIERREYQTQKTASDRQQLSFADAAAGYLEAGRRRKYVSRLVKHFGETPLTEIDQAAIDAAAIAICPATTNGTRNASVYTPLSAILHHAGIKMPIRRPAGAKGRVVTDWLAEHDARAIIHAADAIAADFGLFLRCLLYTGLRLNEVLTWRWEDFDFATSQPWVRRLKGGIPSPVRLRPDLMESVKAMLQSRQDGDGPPNSRLARSAPSPLRGEGRGEGVPHVEGAQPTPYGRVFRFHAGGHFKHMLTRAKLTALGIACPVRRPTGWRQPPNRFTWVNYHTFRHTWATWMRRAGTDVQGLVATGNWRDARSAARYAHAVAREEWQRVDGLPSIEKKSG